MGISIHIDDISKEQPEALWRTGGKVTQPQVIAIVQEFGLPHVGAVFQRQDLIPQIRTKIEALLEGGAQ